MNKIFKKILSKPKSVIPAFAIIIAVFTFVVYGKIGLPPEVSISSDSSLSNPAIEAGSNISLSFSKNGRLKDLLVKQGDKVKKGQALAHLSAPDAEGAVNQAKGALDLAEAQYASLNVEYASTKKQQDLIVENAYRTMLSEGLEGVPSEQDSNTPVISGTYSCGKEGFYVMKPYASGDNDSGFSVNYSGLETGTMPVKYDNAVSLGDCGLQIKFTHSSNFKSKTIWTIDVPNKKSASYLGNKNAYDLAVSNREKILSDFITKIGSGTENNSVAQAQVNAAKGAYEAALGAYQNNVISSPVDGEVAFVDPDLKIGQSVEANKAVISISVK